MDSLTVDELVAALQRTSIPTILVEGRDDMTTYRWIEHRFGPYHANVMQCGGRKQLLDVFERRAEFANLATVFLADRDMWLFTAVPRDYRDLVLTKGYSIENDILYGSHVHDLLSVEENHEFELIADSLSVWFAFEVEQFRSGQAWCVNIHPNRLILLGTTKLNLRVIAPRKFHNPKSRLQKSIRNHFLLRFRGKSLLQLYLRLFNSPQRRSKFSKHNLLEIGTLLDDSRYLRRLVNRIRQRL